MVKTISIRLGYIQRTLPSYRVGFFEELASRCTSGFSLFHGRPAGSEQIKAAEDTGFERSIAKNRTVFPKPFHVSWQVGLGEWLNSFEPELLIAEANPRLVSSLQAVGWMHKKGRKVIGHGLGTTQQGKSFRRLRAYFRRKYLQNFDGFLAYSSSAAEQYRAIVGERPIAIAKNAVCSRKGLVEPTRPKEFADRPTAVFVGRLTPEKRVDTLVKSIAMCKSCPRLVVVGDGPERAQLERLAEGQHIVFTGALHGNDLTRVLTESDLFVLPGTGGLAIHDALARGLPVICGQGDGTQLDSVRLENGWVLGKVDSRSLAIAMDEAFENPAKLREMGAAGFRIARDEISIETMVDSVCELVAKFQACQ